MKAMSIKLQKIFMFIPFLNMIGIFVWLYNCIVLKVKVKHFLKSLIMSLPLVVVFGLLTAVVARIFGMNSVLYNVISYVAVYLFPLAIWFALVKFQENYNSD